MTERKTDPNVRLIGQVALTSILWAGTFVAAKSEYYQKNYPALYDSVWKAKLANYYRVP